MKKLFATLLLIGVSWAYVGVSAQAAETTTTVMTVAKAKKHHHKKKHHKKKHVSA
ncbi:MAG TPA: hypothetical protein VH619_03885 [Verrucomicrobiae bacterium]|jgi:hypothetical protein|nr:hypothetical protein [Verrucomicrobiae bacterium]